MRALLLLAAALGAGCTFEKGALLWALDAGAPVDQGGPDLAGDAQGDAPRDAPAGDAAGDGAAPADALGDAPPATDVATEDAPSADAVPQVDTSPQSDTAPQQDACVPSCVARCGGDLDGCGTPCPDPCSGHGTCAAGACTCATGYAGAACDGCAPWYAGYPTCVPCGASGQACCPSDICTTGRDCVAGTCRPKCDDDMVRVNQTNVCIDRYEASKNGSAAQSVAGVAPWAHLHKAEAATGCSNAGKRLCTVAEWQGACGGPDGQAYPYGASFVAGRCNDRNAGQCLGDGSGVQPTGSLAACVGFDPAVFDLSGNVWEWLADTQPGGCATAGGSVDSCADPTKLSCGYYKYAECSLRWNGLGFRCCLTQAW